MPDEKGYKEKLMNERNQTVDILRGITAIAVVLGHAIQRGLVTGYSDTLLWKFINAWHMPMFMLLAGYILYGSFQRNRDALPVWLLTRFKRLVIPKFVWSYIIYFMRDLPFVGIKPFITFPFFCL